jgi:hypothetical protein
MEGDPNRSPRQLIGAKARDTMDCCDGAPPVNVVIDLVGALTRRDVVAAVIVGTMENAPADATHCSSRGSAAEVVAGVTDR